MTTPLFKKLNLKAPTAIVVLDAPASFEPELAALEGVAILREAAEASFAIAFVRTFEAVGRRAAELAAACPGDAILWFAYPKQSSKRYRGELNCTGGWEALGAAGFECVRVVAIDADWSALRFRRVEFIPKLTRKSRPAAPAEGKRRTGEAAG